MFQVACWLLDPGSKEPTLHNMVTRYLPHELPLLDGIGTGQGNESLGLGACAAHSGRYRATIEAVLVFHVMDHLNSLLRKDDLQGKKTRVWQHYNSGDFGGERRCIYLFILSHWYPRLVFSGCVIV